MPSDSCARIAAGAPKQLSPDGQVGRDSIEFYFDFISPFGWIAAERIRPLAAQLGRSVTWCPILLKATVMDKMGLPPLLEIPLKGAYSYHDAKRSARYHGLRMAPEVEFNFSSVNALRSILWCTLTMPDIAGDFVMALYRRRWAEGGDISSADAVLDVADGLDLPKEALAHVLASDAIKTQLRDAIARAIAKGVFGSPSMIVDGELFWGADRLNMALEWASRGGW